MLAEVVVTPPPGEIGVHSMLAEVVVGPDLQAIRVTSMLAEVVVTPLPPELGVHSLLAEVVVSPLAGVFIPATDRLPPAPVRRITVDLLGCQAPPLGCWRGALSAAESWVVNFGEGNGDDEYQVVGCIRGTLSGGGAQVDVDFLTELDQFGEPGALTDVAALYFLNEGPGTVQLRQGSTDPWSSLFKAVPGGTDLPYLEFPPGAFVLNGGFKAGDYPVGAGNSTVCARLTSGDTAVITMVWLGRR